MTQRAQTALQQASEHLRQDHAEAAIECLSQLGDRAFENHEVLYLLGLAHGKQRRLDHALSCLEKSVELKPDYVPARYHLALAWKAKGDLAKTTAHLKEVLRQNPAHQPARDLLRQLTSVASPTSATAGSIPSVVGVNCPECKTPNPPDYIRCSLCGAMSAEAVKRKEAEAEERRRIGTQVAEPQEKKEERRATGLFYGVIGGIAAASIFFEAWWLVLHKRAFGDSISHALLMMALTLVVEAVVPFLIGLVWFLVAWWVEDKSRVLRASMVLGAACVTVEVVNRLVIHPTLGVIVALIVPFGGVLISFCLYYIAVMFVLEREIHLRLDASYGAAVWLTIALMIGTFLGTFGVSATGVALNLSSRLSERHSSTRGAVTDLPIYPGAQSEGQMVDLGPLGKTAMYKTNSNDPQEVISYFRAEMPNQGWTFQGEQLLGEMTDLSFSKETRQVQLQVMTNGRPVRYSVVELKQ